MKKYKVRRKKKTLNKWFVFAILIIILIFISTSYALLNAELYINGTIIGKYTEPELPVEVPSQGTDENGVNRYTSNTELKFWGVEIYRVVAEEYNDNVITTTIRHMYKQSFSWSSITGTFTLTIPNNSSSNFTDGTIEIVDSSDANNIFQNIKPSISSTTIAPGGTANVTIQGTLKGNLDVADNTFYKFAISYKVGEVRQYFYFNIIFQKKGTT